MITENSVVGKDDQSFQADSQNMAEAVKKAATAAVKMAKSMEEVAVLMAKSSKQANELETSRDNTLRASTEVSKSMRERLMMATANAHGDYRQGQRIAWDMQYDDLTQKIMEQSPQLPESTARAYARSQMTAEARYKLDSQDPRKKAKMEKAEAWSLKRMAAGGDGLLDGVTKIKPGTAQPWQMDRFAIRGTASVSKVSPVAAKTRNEGQAPSKDSKNSELQNSVASISTDIKGIKEVLTNIFII